MVCAFLRSGDDILLMKRADSRVYNPGFWNGIGGYIESAEINDPLSACYREIEEETGIHRACIDILKLKYMIVRRSKDELRLSYIFFGETSQSDVSKTDEGTLFWIPRKELLNRPFTATYAAMLAHYMSTADEALIVGVAEQISGKLRVSWSRCEAFEPV